MSYQPSVTEVGEWAQELEKRKRGTLGNWLLNVPSTRMWLTGAKRLTGPLPLNIAICANIILVAIVTWVPMWSAGWATNTSIRFPIPRTNNTI